MSNAPTGLDLRNALTTLFRSIANAFGLEVVFGEQRPQCTWDKIYVGDVPLDLESNIPAPFTTVAEVLDVSRGNGLHEAGHVAFTDRDIYLEGAGRGPLERMLMNAIEDVREERETSRDHAGVRGLLAKSVDVMKKVGLLRIQPESDGDAFASYVCAWGGVKLNGQPALQETLDVCGKRVEKLLGENGRRRIDAFLNQHYWSLGRGKAGTADTVKMMGGLLRLLKDIEEEQRDQQKQSSKNGKPGQKEGGGTGNGSQSSGNQTGDPPPNGAGDKQGSGQGQQTDQDPNAGGSGNTDGQPDPGAGNGAGSDKGRGQKTGASKILNDKSPSSGSLVQYDKAMSIIGTGGTVKAPQPVAPVSFIQENTAQYVKVRGEVSSYLSNLLAALVSAVKAMVRRDRTLLDHGRRIAPSRLYREETDDPRIFVHKTERRDVDAAVTILMDATGSMAGLKAVEAAKSMALLAEGCNRLGVKLEILAFNSGNTYALKTFDMRFQACLGRIGAYADIIGGGTYLGDAMMQAGYRMVDRREKRKLMFALTDGDTYDEDLTRVAVKSIMGAQISLVGIGIGNKSVCVKKYFPHHLLIGDVKELAPKLMDVLRNHLVTGLAA